MDYDLNLCEANINFLINFLEETMNALELDEVNTRQMYSGTSSSSFLNKNKSKDAAVAFAARRTLSVHAANLKHLVTRNGLQMWQLLTGILQQYTENQLQRALIRKLVFPATQGILLLISVFDIEQEENSVVDPGYFTPEEQMKMASKKARERNTTSSKNNSTAMNEDPVSTASVPENNGEDSISNVSPEQEEYEPEDVDPDDTGPDLPLTKNAEVLLLVQQLLPILHRPALWAEDSELRLQSLFILLAVSEKVFTQVNTPALLYRRRTIFRSKRVRKQAEREGKLLNAVRDQLFQKMLIQELVTGYDDLGRRTEREIVALFDTNGEEDKVAHGPRPKMHRKWDRLTSDLAKQLLLVKMELVSQMFFSNAYQVPVADADRFHSNRGGGGGASTAGTPSSRGQSEQQQHQQQRSSRQPEDGDMADTEMDASPVVVAHSAAPAATSTTPQRGATSYQ
eukprot:GSA120T00007913001.1